MAAAGAETWIVTNANAGLLTGPIGVGKTTVAAQVVGLALRQGMICGGLLAPALVNGCGQKVGIWGVDLLTGERRILARTDLDLGGPRVGLYSFSPSVLQWALGLLEKALHRREPGTDGRQSCDLVIVDEIGKLELWNGIGLAPVIPWLAAGGSLPFLVLVRDSLLGDLLGKLEPIRPIVFSVTEESRGDLAPEILQALLGR